MTSDPDPPRGTGDIGSDTRVIPAEDDQGKQVIDKQDGEIGMVSRVEGDTLYVDPDPSITDKVQAALGWGDTDEVDLPIPPNFVDYIEDKVVLDIKRDKAFQERAG